MNDTSTTRFLRADDGEFESPAGRAINARYLADEKTVVSELLALARLPAAERDAIRKDAIALVVAARARREGKSGIESFLQQYGLASQEGIVLMCLAEALLRIPDAETADKLIADKIAIGQWSDYLGEADSLFVNASTWGLMLTGKLVRESELEVRDPVSFLRRLVARLGEPVVRTAFRHAMRIMGRQFVMGRDIDEALARAESDEGARYRHTYDMLGESALTDADAARYLASYRAAIAAVGRAVRPGSAPASWPSVSVKLSALHPRYEYGRSRQVLAELGPRLESLALAAKAAGIALTVDAEEAERLELSLELLDALLDAPALAGWDGLGLAVQAYSKRAPDVLRYLQRRADEASRVLNVRLVKGAYWDSEVKRAQERGLPGYPVYTRKPNTDVAYLACARILLEGTRRIYPQFATHNAHTAASIIHLAKKYGREFEFQRLHGMGEELYGELTDPAGRALPCRVYAPVGSHEELLPYLVRRLLENGANTSFVNRIVDESLPVKEVVGDPVTDVERAASGPHARIPLPSGLFGTERRNSAGINLPDGAAQRRLAAGCGDALARPLRSRPIVGGEEQGGETRECHSPADLGRVIGVAADADAALARKALDVAAAAQPDWDAVPAAARGRMLRDAADRLERDMARFVGICVAEAGKTVPDSIAEVREAVDFLRYYAARAEADFGRPLALPGPTGESNRLGLRGRGVFACISPWNFPLAIFTGQVSAALAAGNSVIAKPAEQTPIVAAEMVRLLHAAGVPGDVLQFVPGRGSKIGPVLTGDARVAGVAFTGSTETARLINRSLASADGPLPVLIAETGGQNAMIVDSSALPEQVVNDAVTSAFNAAGQRCSALRVLFVQEDIAPRVLELLAGVMDTLAIGDPALLSTDVGPVIDADAVATLDAHARAIVAGSRWHHRARLPAGMPRGHWFAPLAVEIDGIARLEREVFGPVLHVVRFAGDRLEAVVDEINASGYGLTLGVHTRIDGVARRVAARARVGNVYVNRNMIGAVVGVQPFGGCGLSGTGPKAGGPHYLPRFATEQTVTINTAAVGGNATLLSLGES
ncbi:MAG TPA: bifunctional proline dehydrogenase/L-glutamate gamma-semialdehyde dehydrogenase PutA [Steroidobacteraceae bacterium]|nr:bifunctional proline dehydrogenase/L-glutamate gamma-semialdehyde dehydrogenase PutA [Steroidobacteraceae bacterium]